MSASEALRRLKTEKRTGAIGVNIALYEALPALIAVVEAAEEFTKISVPRHMAV
jgi:hypothetical protein